jgi:hypothetical protein
MDKPEVCEWGECTKKPKIYKILDGEKYWFCGEDCAEEFWQWIIESGNY